MQPTVPHLARRSQELVERVQSAPAAPSNAKKPGWKQVALRFSERFGSLLSRVLLTVLYFGVLGPFAIFYRLVADPLHLRRRKKGNWTTWSSRNDTLAKARRQD